LTYKQLDNYIFDCSSCPTRCDGQSKMNYQFASDVEFAEEQENLIIHKINLNQNYKAQKCTKKGYPDIEIFDNKGNLKSYLEVKAQRRTFMSVERILPKSNLKPSETLALNLSDLLRYFKIEKETKIPTSIIWVLMNRPCIVGENDNHFYFQKTSVLKNIYLQEKEKRRFRRKSGQGDIVDGQHKGVVVNYHFSIKELRKWKA